MTREQRLNVSEQHKFVVWSLPRMGTRYLNGIFRQFGLDTGKLPDGRHRAPTHYVGTPGRDYKVICLVRNPYTRALSGWKWRNLTDNPVHPESFEAYIKEVGHGWIRPITSVLANLTSLVDYKIHLENHRAEIEALPFVTKRIKWPPNSYRSHYEMEAEQHYTPDLRKEVFRLYEPDFDFGGYDPEAPFTFES